MEGEKRKSKIEGDDSHTPETHMGKTSQKNWRDLEKEKSLCFSKRRGKTKQQQTKAKMKATFCACHLLKSLFSLCGCVVLFVFFSPLLSDFFVPLIRVPPRASLFFFFLGWCVLGLCSNERRCLVCTSKECEGEEGAAGGR